jgi:hypothetical protein
MGINDEKRIVSTREKILNFQNRKNKNNTNTQYLYQYINYGIVIHPHPLNPSPSRGARAARGASSPPPL